MFLTDSVKRDGAAHDNTGFRRRGNITGRTQAASQGAGQMGLQSMPTLTSPEVIYSSCETCLQILTVQGSSSSHRSQVARTCLFRTQSCAILLIIARQREALHTCSTGGEQIINLTMTMRFSHSSTTCESRKGGGFSIHELHVTCIICMSCYVAGFLGV